MTAFWEKHRPFLLRVAAGMAVFLILENLVGSYQGSAERRGGENEDRAERIREEIDKLNGVYDREQKARALLEECCEDLLGQLSLLRNARIRPPEGGNANASIDFPRTKNDVWSAFTDRADRINLGYPELRDVPFDERRDLTATEWEDRYRLLEVLDRFLNAAVNVKVRRIISIRPAAVASEPVEGSEDLAVLRFPVVVRTVMSYPALLSLMRSFQREGVFTSVELLELRPADEDGEEWLEATLRLVGIDIGEPRSEGKTRGLGPRGWRRPR
ncbi:MAG: hypothetical protein ACE5GW_01335 [Planctomycetota bacterium]